MRDYDVRVHLLSKPCTNNGTDLKALSWLDGSIIFKNNIIRRSKLQNLKPWLNSHFSAKGKGILFYVGGQTGKDCLLTWADGVKVADRRDTTEPASFRSESAALTTAPRDPRQLTFSQ